MLLIINEMAISVLFIFDRKVTIVFFKNAKSGSVTEYFFQSH